MEHSSIPVFFLSHAPSGPGLGTVPHHQQIHHRAVALDALLLPIALEEAVIDLLGRLGGCLLYTSLPQRKLAQTAAAGYSSYGNQIGLATGHVAEVYHEGYIAKRLDVYKRQGLMALSLVGFYGLHLG